MQRLVGKIVAGMAIAYLFAASAAFAGSASTLNTSSNSNNNWAAMRGFDPLGVAGPGSSHPDTGDMSVYLDQSTEFGFGVTSGTSDMTICQGRVDCSFTANDNAFIEGGSAAMGAALDPATQPGNIGNSGYYLLSYTEDGDDGFGNPLFTQGLRNDALSKAVNPGENCDTLLAQAGQARCNEFDYGFSQALELVGGITTDTGGAAGGVGTGGTQVFDLFFSVDALVDADGNLLSPAEGTWTLDNPGGAGTCSGTFSYDSGSGVTVTGAAGLYTLAGGRTSGNCP